MGVKQGLTISLLTLLNPGDEIIVPSHTFFATVESIVAVGGVPVFVDIDPETYLLNPAKIECKITKNTKIANGKLHKGM